LGRVDDKRMGLAERQEPEAVVEVAVGHQDASDRRVPRTAGMERRGGLDLRAGLGGRGGEGAVVVVGAPPPPPPGARDGAQGPAPDPAAVGAAAVPLRDPSASRRAQDVDPHGPLLLIEERLATLSGWQGAKQRRLAKRTTSKP